MTEQALLSRIDMLTQAVIQLAQTQGVKLTRKQLAERLGIHPNSITRRLAEDRNFPRPDPLGRWLLADVIAWESASERDR
jgi:predicted DNA-binding transcriptional regulator AlpA